MSRNNAPKPAKNATPSASAGRRKTEGEPLHIQREVKPVAGPNAEDVRRRAYEIYLHRCTTGEPGCPESDWTRAERELTRA
jgi:hypothetical protein